MYTSCSTCGEENAARARFCVRCGQALPGRQPGRAANTALLAAAVISLITASAAVGPDDVAWPEDIRLPTTTSISGSWNGDFRGPLREWLPRISDNRSKRTRWQNLHLRAQKTGALFNLLKPADIKVVVAQRPDGVRINGTDWESHVLTRLVELVNRMDGADGAAVRSYRLRRSEFRKEYELPNAKRQALYELLAIVDVPVGASVCSEGLCVDAAQEDHEIIAGVVEILHGVRR